MKFKMRALFLALLVVVLATSLVSADDGTGTVPIDDGAMFRRNISKTPDQETERANINHMAFYVPAQAADGTLLEEGIEYFRDDGTDTGELVDTRLYAKPLVSVYIDGVPHEVELEEAGIFSVLSGAGLGQHDAYAAVSLDDGATWKSTNLSLSADLSSFTLANGTPYPGDAHNMTFALAGDKVLVGWISKYCDGGSPLYTFSDDAITDLQTAFGLPDLYVRDIWGVAGSQGSVDYELQGFPEVGEIPYSCVWSARGQLLLDDETGTYDIVWTKAERLTSGRRDANRLEMNGDSAAGFMMTWQEDPEGLRPGQGLGPGEGWSGAVVNQQTDLWYSFIAIDDFNLVDTDADLATEDPVSLDLYDGETMPKVLVPMAMPIRLTDNKMCKKEGSDFYCYVDFDDTNPWLTDLPDELPIVPGTAFTSTLCADTVSWPNPGGVTLSLCETEDGRVLQGRVGASRPRVNVQPYATTTLGVYDSGIVIMGAEESKALGEGSVEEDVEPEDIGKNMMYYSFDLLNPVFVQQGGQLNQPAKDPLTGEFFELLEDDFENPFYETEIARRFSHMSQAIHQFGPSGISSVMIVKQGILNQGGPADIFLRLTKVPDDKVVACPDDSPYDTCVEPGFNPYAYENLVCGEAVFDAEDNTKQISGWAFTDGSNPRYLEGLCLSDMINVSGTSIVSCDNGTSGDTCADDFPWDGVEEDATFPKVTEWSQSGPNYGDTVDATNIGTLDDQSWENPYDVAKGHRGFIDGDFIMMMYAWSPNWQANAVGNDHYNLYARRSFDGGQTWTTLPKDFLDSIELPEGVAVVADGTTTFENYCVGVTAEDCVPSPTTYAAGEFEQARNLSQLIGNKVTILDPRYTPTGGLKMLPVTDKLGVTGGVIYDDDEFRDPSKYFIVYETGDNTTVAEGEAVPMDLFYSRATNFGDDYALAEYYNSTTEETTLGFDWLEHDREDLSGEAANTANNAGTFYYVIWNQWQEDEYENVSESDAWFRRTMFTEDEDAESIDLAPVASILYVSTYHSDFTEEEIVLVGTGRDVDSMNGTDTPMGQGVENVKWWSDIEGHECTEKTWKFPPRDLIPGWHSFSFSVQDNEGNWSSATTVSILFGNYKVYMPIVTR